MSTPDPNQGVGSLSLPAEHRLPAGHVPDPAETQSFAAPTPGVALAGARVAGAPTLPDGDPMGLSILMQRMANEMFGAPPPAPAGVSPGDSPSAHAASPSLAGIGASPESQLASPAAPSVSTPAPIVSAPSPTATPDASVASAPAANAAPASPFEAPLDFAMLSVTPDAQFSFPLIDGLPSIDSAESLHTPAPLPAVSPAPSAAPAFPNSYSQFQPVADLPVRPAAHTPFDPHVVRREFPILDQRVNGKPLVWLDNAATTQKPRAVIDRLTKFYENENSNIHRAAHTLAARATDAYEAARESVRRFLGASSVKEIIFVRGATEGINLVAQSWGRRNVREGDEIVVSHLEHHANIVPWQMLAAEKGAKLRVAPVDDRGQVILEEYEKLLGPKTKIVSFTQVSNALGTITPAKQMVEMAHRYGAKVLLDGAQAVSHMRVDVQSLDPDFYVFSGHKVFAPTGIGAVYGKQDLLEATPPWQGGGNMIADVTFERTVFQGPPARFEAGTGNIADAVGLGTALDWLSRVGIDNVSNYEHELLEYATPRLLDVPGLTMVGTAPEKAGVLSFVLDGQKTEEVGGLLDQEGIAVRSGHHCAQPILRRFGLEATVRASLAPYNTCEDIDALVAALHRLQAGRARVR